MPRAFSVSELGDKLTAAAQDGGWNVQPDHLYSSDGRSVVSRRVKWNVAGRCESPVTVDLYARGGMSVVGRKYTSLEVALSTRCRKCEWCRRKSRLS